MDQRQRRREGSRRAQAARERRLEGRKRRRNRNILYGVVGVLVAIGAIVGSVFLLDGDPGIGIEVATLGASHNPPYVYNQDITIDGEPVRIPPTSGNHFAQWGPYGFWGEPLIPEAVVHNMEHGAAVIWYQPDDPALAAQVRDFVREVGDQCMVAGSYADMSFDVAATVWGRVLPLESFDEDRLREFVQTYRGEAGPPAERGLCRNQS